MTNYVRVNDGIDFGKPAGRLGPIVQGIDGLVMLIDVRDLDGNDFDITGATAIEARMENTYTGAVTAVDGALAVSGGGLSWTFSTNDSGTAGQFSVLFQFTLSGVIYKGIAALTIMADPAVTAVAGAALVGIPADDAAWVAGSEPNMAAGTTDNLVSIGGDDHLEDSGIAKDNVLVDADIGTNVQAHDTGLDDLAALPVTDGNIAVGDGNNWVAESGATARESLGAAALGANTFTGDQDLDGNAITGYVEGVTTVSPSTSYAISMLDEVVVITLSDNLSISFTDIAAGASVTVHLIQDGTGSRVPTWTGVSWPGGAEPTLSTAAGARDKLVFDSYNGTVVDGHEVGLDMS